MNAMGMYIVMAMAIILSGSVNRLSNLHLLIQTPEGKVEASNYWEGFNVA